MPGLSLSQRLTGPEGLPTSVATLIVLALMLVTAAAGFAVGPRGDRPEEHHRTIPASRLAGDLPIAAPEQRPALRAAAALPRIRGTRQRRRTVARAETAPSSAPTAATAGTPEPAATPEPATPEAPVASPPAAPPAQVPAAAPRPRATPAPTFDSIG